jgi:integrase
MSRAAEIYPLESILQRELKKAAADPFNADLILNYHRYRTAEGISLARVCKCVGTVRRLSRLLGKPFASASKEDFVRLVSDLERSGLSDWTKRDYKILLKQFYKWLRDWEEGYPPEVRWIKHARNIENKRQILPQDLLTPEEKLAMLRATQNPRDRALLEIYFESGRRMGEVLTLHIRDVEFDDLGAKLHVNGKIGEDYIRVISSRASLGVWLDTHPLRDDPDAPVWIGLGHENRLRQLNYGAARTLLRKIVKRAGIRKRIFFYLFRYTRIDETQGTLTEDQQCVMLGWKYGSDMPRTYKKRYGKHIDAAQALMNGIKKPTEERPATLKPKNCARCKADNSPASKFCNRCGNVLDVQTAVKMDEARGIVEKIIEQLANDPEKMEKVARLVK